MAGYDFLSDLVILEVAQFGPDALGGYLADMGATVIKVEPPRLGDPTRWVGYEALGDGQGEGYLHLRWNRGKKSVALDLQSAEGRELFKLLAANADVLIEGMRAGVLERLGLGYDVLREINPRLVYSIVSGMGLTGPYAPMASHGPAFDAFGGLGPSPDGDDVSLVGDRAQVPVGMHAVSLHAALGTLAAVMRARRTGEGALLDVAAADSSVHWLPEKLDAVLNPDKTWKRAGFADSKGRMIKWPRLDNYRGSDGKPLLLMAHSDRAWAAFCSAVDRMDLASLYEQDDREIADAACRNALIDLFATKPRDAWIDELQTKGVPIIAAYTVEEIPEDPHFRSRDNTYVLDHPSLGRLTLTSTPIKAAGQSFAPSLAPTLGEHTDEVLSDRLSLGPDEIASLKSRGIAG